MNYKKINRFFIDDIWGQLFKFKKMLHINKQLAKAKKIWKKPKGYVSLSLNRNEDQYYIKELKTTYAKKLNLRRKFRCFYGGYNEHQFRKIIKNYFKQKGNLLQIIVGCFETKINILLFRVGFVLHIDQANELIKNGMIRINGARFFHPSVLVKIRQIVTISKKTLLTKVPLKILAKKDLIKFPFSYLYISYKLLTFILIRKPYLNEIKFPFKCYSNKIFLKSYI
jgi:ribosomal protein S4